MSGNVTAITTSTGVAFVIEKGGSTVSLVLTHGYDTFDEDVKFITQVLSEVINELDIDAFDEEISLSKGAVVLLRDLLSSGVDKLTAVRTMIEAHDRHYETQIVASLLSTNTPILGDTFAIYSRIVDMVGERRALALMSTATSGLAQRSLAHKVNQVKHLVRECVTDGAAFMLTYMPSRDGKFLLLAANMVSQIQDEAEWEEVRRTQWVTFSSRKRPILSGESETVEIPEWWQEIFSLFIYLNGTAPIVEARQLLEQDCPPKCRFTMEQLLAVADFYAKGMGSNSNLALQFYGLTKFQEIEEE